MARNIGAKSAQRIELMGHMFFSEPCQHPGHRATSLDHFYRMTLLHGLMENCASSRVTITRSWEAKQVLRAQRIVLEGAFAGAPSRAAG